MSSTNTWRQLIDDASSGWVLQEWQRRRRQLERLGVQPRSSYFPTPGKGDAEGADGDAPCEAGSKLRKGGGLQQRSGGGGAYRAFLRESTQSGHIFVEGELSARYRSLAGEEMNHFKRVGQEMTHAHRARCEAGMPRLSQQRVAQRSVRKAAIAAAVEERLVSHDTGAAPEEQPLLAALMPGGSDCMSKFKAAKLEGTLSRMAADARDERAVAAIGAFEQHCRQEAVQSLTAMCSHLPPGVTDDFCSVPLGTASFDAVEFCPDAWGFAKLLVSKAMAQPRKYQDFLNFLEHEWWKNHQTVLHETSEPITQSTWVPSECMRAGVCLCSPAGKTTKMFGAAWSCLFKAAFPRGHPQRALVTSASIVLLLRVEPPVTDAEGQAAKSAPVCLFWHLASVSWSPYQVGFHRLVLSETTSTGYALEASSSSTTHTLFRLQLGMQVCLKAMP
eukprot:687011-Heterocapsa_arctica.AAC.1